MLGLPNNVYKFKSVTLLPGLLYLVFMQFEVCGGLATATVPPAGLPAMQKIECLPLLPPSGTQTRQFSSYDPSGGNEDGTVPETWSRRLNERGEMVFFDEYGPGCLYRQQMNLWKSKLDPKKTWIRYYFNGEKEPSISMTVDQFWGRKGYTAPFVPPLSYFDDLINPHRTNLLDRMGVCYLPMPFKKRLQVTLSPAIEPPGKGGAWFQYTYQLLPADSHVRSWTKKADVKDVVTQWQNLGQDPKPDKGNQILTNTVTVPHGQSAELLNFRGAGSLTALHLTLQPFTAETFYQSIIRIYWDDATTPAVEMPLGNFFGGGGGLFPHHDQIWNLDLKTLLYGYNKTNGTFYSYWSMPFWKSARVVIENQDTNTDIGSLTLQVDYKPASVLSYPAEQTGYFHARRTLDAETNNAGLFVHSFSERGWGKVVALTFFADHWSPDGDEFTYMDGSLTPQIHGDGSEDDHNGGWGNDRYHKPLWGSFSRWGDFAGIQQDYRIYLNDSYVFHHDINILYECAHFGDRKWAQTESTVFYYLRDGMENLHETDELDVGNGDSERAHDYQVTGQTWQGTLTSAYDGFEKKRDFHAVTDDGRAFTGASSFVVGIDPNNDGVRLRRRVDRRQHGVQLARVWVDGRQVGERPWLLSDLSDEPENQCWRDTDFDIPARYTRGKQRIQVKIQYVADPTASSELNEFHYWIYSFGPQPCSTQEAGQNLDGTGTF